MIRRSAMSRGSRARGTIPFRSDAGTRLRRLTPSYTVAAFESTDT